MNILQYECEWNDLKNRLRSIENEIKEFQIDVFPIGTKITYVRGNGVESGKIIDYSSDARILVQVSDKCTRNIEISWIFEAEKAK